MFIRPANVSVPSILASKYLPFFVIGEFHYGDDDNDLAKYMDSTGKFDPDKTIRTDDVSIKLPGFSQQFCNNQSALLSYLQFVANSYYVTLEINIIVNDSSREDDLHLSRILGISTATKMKSEGRSFNKIELPGNLADCYR